MKILLYDNNESNNNEGTCLMKSSYGPDMSILALHNKTTVAAVFKDMF